MILYDEQNKPFIKYSSDEVDKVLTSLVKAHKEFKPLQKTGKAQYGTFASLTDIWNACGESLEKNGLSVISRIARLSTKNMFVLTLFHIESGQFLSSASDMGDYKTIHGYGSLITYFRRYLLTPMLNLEGDYDDDGDMANSDDIDAQYDYSHSFKPYRYFNSKGEMVDDTDSMADWSKKISNLIYYMKDGNRKNLPTLKANRKELERVCKTLKLLQKQSPEKINNVHTQTLETIENSMEILNAK